MTTRQFSTGVESLFNAVINQAWKDCFAPKTFGTHGNNIKRVQAEAESFLLDRVGGWAKSRDEICSAAGVDPDALRDRAVREFLRLQTRQDETDALTPTYL